jgi:hypothetical protein
MKATYLQGSFPPLFAQALHEEGGTPSHLTLRSRQLLHEMGCRLPLRPKTDNGQLSVRGRLALLDKAVAKPVKTQVRWGLCCCHTDLTTHSGTSSPLGYWSAIGFLVCLVAVPVLARRAALAETSDIVLLKG